MRRPGSAVGSELWLKSFGSSGPRWPATGEGDGSGGSRADICYPGVLWPLPVVSGELTFGSRKAWRRWLEQNHASKNEAFLLVYKRAPKNADFSNETAIQEALCFGWIDGWFKPVDDERWVLRFSPRRRGSNWSDTNIARAWKLLAEGRMTPSGIAKLPPGVLAVWKNFKPTPTAISPRRGEITFEGMDRRFLARVKRPAVTP